MSRDELHLQLRAFKLDRKDGMFGKSDPFFILEREREADGAHWLPVFKSEVRRNTLNPVRAAGGEGRKPPLRAPGGPNANVKRLPTADLTRLDRDLIYV